LRPIRILLVEDSPTDVELTVEALEEARFANELDVVSDGVEAMAHLRQEGAYADAARPDLVLLDLHLPRKSGGEVLQEIKEDRNLRALPVIVLTTSAEEEDVEHAYRNHVNAYVRKPVDFTDFIAKIRAIEDFWIAVVTLPGWSEAPS